jgi:hypothetical protein
MDKELFEQHTQNMKEAIAIAKWDPRVHGRTAGHECEQYGRKPGFRRQSLPR